MSPRIDTFINLNSVSKRVIVLADVFVSVSIIGRVELSMF